MYLNIRLTLQTQGFQSPPEGEIDSDVGAGGRGGRGGGGARQHEESMNKIYGVAELLLIVQWTENFAFNTNSRWLRQHETVDTRSRSTDKDMNEMWRHVEQTKRRLVS
jgi:hypothetical protein